MSAGSSSDQDKIVRAFAEEAVRQFSLIIHELGLRSGALSQWMIAGSVAGTFTVLMTLDDLTKVYGASTLMIFLCSQIVSIAFGILFLFGHEASNSAQRTMIRDPRYLSALVAALKTEGADPAAKDVFQRSGHVIGHTFKASLPLFAQALALLISVGTLVCRAMAFLNKLPV